MPVPRSMLKKARPKKSLAERIRGRRKARKPRVLTVPAKKQVSTIVKREISKQVEQYLNFGRTLYQISGTAPVTFEGARYFLGNLGGIIDINGQTVPPMKTINAIAVNSNIATGIPAYNQAYKGKSIYGKYFKSKIQLVLPSIKTQPTGTSDWQQMPQNYEYRFIIFKTKAQPAINNAAAGFTNAPFTQNGFKNEVGSSFGIGSDDTDALPDPTGAPMRFINQDLINAPVNKTNFTVLMEKRGRISPGSAMNATNNPASVTQGPRQYSSEANFTFTHKINKKLNLQLETDTVQTAADVTGLQRITNYDTSLCFFLVMSPLGEGLPTSLSRASNWNVVIDPYIHIHNSFTFTDM